MKLEKSFRIFAYDWTLFTYLFEIAHIILKNKCFAQNTQLLRKYSAVLIVLWRLLSFRNLSTFCILLDHTRKKVSHSWLLWDYILSLVNISQSSFPLYHCMAAYRTRLILRRLRRSVDVEGKRFGEVWIKLLRRGQDLELCLDKCLTHIGYIFSNTYWSLTTPGSEDCGSRVSIRNETQNLGHHVATLLRAATVMQQLLSLASLTDLFCICKGLKKFRSQWSQIGTPVTEPNPNTPATRSPQQFLHFRHDCNASTAVLERALGLIVVSNAKSWSLEQTCWTSTAEYNQICSC